MLNNDLTRTDFHFKIIKFYLFALLFEISSMIFIPKYVYIRWKKKKEKNHKKWIIRLCDRDPLSSSSRRIDAAASLDLRGHYSWISRVFHAYTCRSRIQRRSRCIVLWLSSRRKRACGIEEVRSIDRKRLARRFFLRPYKGKRERQVRLAIYFATLNFNFPRYYKFSCFSGY